MEEPANLASAATVGRLGESAYINGNATVAQMPEADRSVSILSRQVNNNDHIQGVDSALVTLVMYGAYECPFCVEGNRIVKQIQRHFGETLRFVFRHFPRSNIHPHAEAASEVAEAAADQNRFWEMHHTLFENYTRLDGEHLISYAADLRLDMERFDRGISGRVFAKKVREDLMSGMESGVTGTPTYFIDNIKHSGSAQFPALVDAIDAGVIQRRDGK